MNDNDVVQDAISETTHGKGITIKAIRRFLSINLIESYNIFRIYN